MDNSFWPSTFELVEHYIQRPDIDAKLQKHLLDNNSYVESPRTIIVWGDGGSGKTQVVFQYAQTHQADFNAVFWLNAARKELLERDVINLCRKLHVTSHISGYMSGDMAIVGILRWLSTRQGPWLLVFDGLDENESTQSVIGAIIKNFALQGIDLRIVITSRVMGLEGIIGQANVQVSAMQRQEAVELFHMQSRIPRGDEDVDAEIVGILEELGYLPLALCLAATYVRETAVVQSDVHKYLAQYRGQLTHPEESKLNESTSRPGNCIAAVLKLSYNAILMYYGTISTFVDQLACLSFDDVGPKLFKRPVMKDLDILQRYNIIQRHRDLNKYSMHEAIHTWCYENLDDDDRSGCILLTLMSFIVVLTEHSSSSKDMHQLAPHAVALFRALRATNISSPSTMMVFLKAIRWLDFCMAKAGKLEESKDVREYLMLQYRQLLGPEDPATLHAMLTLATSFHTLGQRHEAFQLKRDVVEAFSRALPENPHTARTLADIAFDLEDSDRLEDILVLLKTLYEKTKRVLSEDHPVTISCANKVAHALKKLDRLDEAIVVLRDVLVRRTGVLGEDHPDTLQTKNVLNVMLAAVTEPVTTLGVLESDRHIEKSEGRIVTEHGHVSSEEHDGGSHTLESLNMLVSSLIYKRINQNQIRTIYIDSFVEGVVCCSLSTVSRDESSYVALSYEWGTSEKPVAILLNDQIYYITQNLHQALCNLGEHRAGKIFWIDALSINQCDDIERGVQVRNMRSTYAAANDTVVWLGQGNTHISTMLGFISSLRTIDGYDENSLRQKISNASPDIFELMTLSALEISQLSYWSRVWIVQEMRYSRAIHLLYGQRILSGADFRLFWELLYNEAKMRAITMLEDIIFSTRQALLGESFPLQGILESGVGLSNNYVDIDTWCTKACIDYYCTDPRDMVYGFYGCFAPNVRNQIVVDYTLPVLEVFRNMTETVIKSTGNLMILSTVDILRLSTHAETSWVPNFVGSATGLIPFLNLTYRGEPLSEMHRPRFTSLGDLHTLLVKAICLGPIQRISINTQYEPNVAIAGEPSSLLQSFWTSVRSHHMDLRVSQDETDQFSFAYQGGVYDGSTTLRAKMAGLIKVCLKSQNFDEIDAIHKADDNSQELLKGFRSIALFHLRRSMFSVNLDSISPGLVLYGLGPDTVREEHEIWTVIGCPNALAFQKSKGNNKLIGTVYFCVSHTDGAVLQDLLLDESVKDTVLLTLVMRIINLSIS